MSVFMAMNTDIEVVDAPIAPIEALFLEWHRRLTRFEESSELSALNRSGGEWFAASPLLQRVVTRALYWAGLMDGYFDPTVAGALEHAGYDRTFELVVDSGPLAGWRATSVTPTLSRGGRERGSGWQDVRVDGDHILVPEGVRLDLGGIAKGMAVDAGLAPFDYGMVNVGGDLYAKGGEYLVGVEDPLDPERDLVTLRVGDRGVATSSTWKRRWSADAHHLIDPRTGEPSQTDVLSATVIAGSAEEAEVAAKVALLLGLDEGHWWLELRGTAGLLVGRDGTLLASAGFEDYVAVA